MTLPRGTALLLSRMALLEPKPVELEHGREGHIIIGWRILPDELMKTDEGLRMVRAVEIAARLNFAAMRKRLLEI